MLGGPTALAARFCTVMAIASVFADDGVGEAESGIGPWVFADVDGDGQISERERKIFHSTFLEIDRNGDGYIDRQEVQELARSLKLAFTAQEVDEIMTAMTRGE
eukprot:SAG31_NODE_4241_length_3425_cov_8.954600_2_plen_104_part_00